MRAPRLALEIDDEDVVLDDQHLAEMEVAVVADIEPVDIARQQRLQPIRQGRLLRQQLVGQRHGRPPSANRADASARRTRVRRAPGYRPIQRCTSSGRVGSGAKSGMSLLAGERDVHLGDAPSGLRHVAQIGSLFLAFAGMFARRQQPLFVDKAIEIGRRHGPGVALVGHEGMDDTRSRSCGRPRPVRRCRASAGVLAKPATSVRKRPISISGLMPASSLR